MPPSTPERGYAKELVEHPVWTEYLLPLLQQRIDKQMETIVDQGRYHVADGDVLMTNFSQLDAAMGILEQILTDAGTPGRLIPVSHFRPTPDEKGK